MLSTLSTNAGACHTSEKHDSTAQKKVKDDNSLKAPKAHSLQQPCLSSQPTTDDYIWMEKLHESVSNSVYQSALWFDNFFLDDNVEQMSPKTTARIRFGWLPKVNDLSKLDTRFRIKVKLPHFKNKMDIVLSDDDDSNQSDLPLEAINSRTDIKEESFSAAVRYTHNKSKNRVLESRIGISGGDIFLKTRHKRILSFSNISSIKIEPSLYYFLNDGLGSKLLLEYNYQADERSQYRLNYSVRASESFTGLKWKHGFYKLTQLQQKTASVIGLQVNGERNGDRGFVIDKYTLSYRYRFNALRSWLFFEIEPFLEWPEEKHYQTTPGIALRVEGYFHKG